MCQNTVRQLGPSIDYENNIYVFIVVLANIHLYLMEVNSLGHFYNLLIASVQKNIFKDVCIANSLGR